MLKIRRASRTVDYKATSVNHFGAVEERLTNDAKHGRNLRGLVSFRQEKLDSSKELVNLAHSGIARRFPHFIHAIQSPKIEGGWEYGGIMGDIATAWN